MMNCIRCGEEFDKSNSNICGSCADDLRQEEEAMAMSAQAEAEADAMNREAYEEAQRENELDYRYL